MNTGIPVEIPGQSYTLTWACDNLSAQMPLCKWSRPTQAPTNSILSQRVTWLVVCRRTPTWKTSNGARAIDHCFFLVQSP